MQLLFDMKNCYDASWDIKFQGTLNDAHWYVWEANYDEIILVHDLDEDIINACKALGDSIFVWIDGERTECPLSVNKENWSNTERVYVTLELNPEETALDQGPNDIETHAELY